jgi:hypothetical protein
MPVMSVTRLRVGAWRYLPGFLWYTYQSKRQLTRSPGFLGGALANAPAWTFWTTTVWTDDVDEALPRCRLAKKAMPRLLDYCSEASLAHWTEDTADLPTGRDARTVDGRDRRRCGIQRPATPPDRPFPTVARQDPACRSGPGARLPVKLVSSRVDLVASRLQAEGDPCEPSPPVSSPS